MAIAELVAQMRKTLEYHQGTLPFQIPHYLRHAIFGWNLDAHIVLRYFPYICLRLNFGAKTM